MAGVRAGGGRLAVQSAVWAIVPPQVGYALTERGRSLLHVVRVLAGRADAHAPRRSAGPASSTTPRRTETTHPGPFRPAGPVGRAAREHPAGEAGVPDG
ncbi:hypothetical protein ACH5AL_21695 [Actinacidiphila glaucinigra]|uniref:hypothetical protein n=1 Tax=Actinacidiphila glaucinigra TaxID=235986 RepID=UPI00378D3EC5